MKHNCEIESMEQPHFPLKIAYTPSGGSTWTGGLTYQKNLLFALQEYAPEVTVYLLSEKMDGIASDPKRKQIAIKNNSDADFFSKVVNKISIQLFGKDYLLEQTLRGVPGGAVDIVFPGRYKAGRGTAVLYWIPDFQYIHLPEMYSKANIASLNQKYLQGTKNATLVVLSSNNACQDYQKFAPDYIHKARVVSFVAHIPTSLYDLDPTSVVKKYHLPERFFYLPNQIWKHKNHEIVFKALKILKSRDITPFIVLTGNPIDSRNPLFFADLIQKISEWGLRDQVAFLGLIPHDDVYKLIRQSLCVLNPSLFEGWSTTVEETKSVGKRLILSDLPVHREQDPPESIYFDPHNPEQLAEILAEFQTNLPPGPDTHLEEEAARLLPERLKKFAHRFVEVASEAVSIASGIK
jgi:glycosyltransferase involved in cell wall biosynthesis